MGNYRISSRDLIDRHPGADRLGPLDTTAMTDEERIALVYANETFIKLMAQAIRDGLERPPMVGVDKRPCTKNPWFISPKPSSDVMGSRSVAGSVVDRAL